MESIAPDRMIRWLRACGEPSRLRLLALCAQGALSVSDLAQALRQSEPRVSRHLKILSEAGLIERERHGQWVHYRIAAAADAASFVAGLLAQLDRRDDVLARDRAGAHTARPSDAGLAGESRLGRALAGLLGAAEGAGVAGSALIAGVSHPELIESAARTARPCVAVAQSRRAAQAARAFIERRGLSCRVLESVNAARLGEAEIARAGGPFAMVVLDHPAAEALAGTLKVAARALLPQGRLWIFEGYEALESARQRVVEHPLARLRRLLGDAGLTCERLSPIEADGQHVLAAVARPAAAHGAHAGAAAGAA